MLIEEHIKLINILHQCPCEDIEGFIDMNDIILHQGYKTNTAEVIIDGRHYLVIGLFSSATADILKSWE